MDGRVEAVIFASPEPVGRDMLARVVGRDCSIDLLIDDIRGELRGRPYELVSAAGGWQHRTRRNFVGAKGVFATKSDPLEALELSDSLLDAGAPFVDGVCEEARLALLVGASGNDGDDAA